MQACPLQQSWHKDSSQTSEQDPICPRLTLTLRGTVGGREVRLEMLAGTIVLKPAFLPGAQTFKGQDVLRLVPAAAHGPAGASPGVSAQSCQGSWHLLCLGAKERPLMRSLCELQEPGPSHCWTAEKGWGHISPQLGTLLAHQDILKQAGEGCQPLHSGNPSCSKVTYLKFSQTTEWVRGGREVPAEIRVGKTALHPLFHSGWAEGLHSTGRPPTPSLPGCRTAANMLLTTTPRPRTGCC